MTRLPRVTLLILVLSACAAGPARGQSVPTQLENAIARVDPKDHRVTLWRLAEEFARRELASGSTTTL